MSLKQRQLQSVEAVARRRGRFSPEAYVFTYEALDFTMERREREGRRGHITGGELLEGIEAYGRKCFGYLGKAVFEAWGLKSSSDFGDVVFDLVEAEVLSKQDSDTREDFDGGFEFREAFETRFIHE
jgi:uncharacterized repeat protein (TIGR04138 family)